jgi:hypothetical protein
MPDDKIDLGHGCYSFQNRIRAFVTGGGTACDRLG